LKNNIVIIGFGSIGQAILPLLQQHFPSGEIIIIESNPTENYAKISKEFSTTLIREHVNINNYCSILTPLLKSAGYLLNLATAVSSMDLIKLAQEHNVFYLDTCIEPWKYAHAEFGIETTNYELREQVLAIKSKTKGKTTSLIAHGANPGFVSVLMKKGLIEMADAVGLKRTKPSTANEWASLAKELDIKVIQISEHDTQMSSSQRQCGEFVNTWSVDGFVTELLQPAELGWGSHEKRIPDRGVRNTNGSKAAIWIDKPSLSLKVRSWSPNSLNFDGYLVTHHEAISIADYLTLKDEENNVIYRPTSYYAYHPCGDAISSIELLNKFEGINNIKSMRIMRDDIASGMDELGVFLISGSYSSLWIGSNLSIDKARKTAKLNNATSLQVVSSIIAAMEWMKENPNLGIIESEDLDYEFIYNVVEPYWAPIAKQYLTWHPGKVSSELQFEDFIVTI
jgi:homospermidine synthase